MTDSLIAPITVMVPPAETCDGEFCAIPVHHTQAVVNRKLDDDAV